MIKVRAIIGQASGEASSEEWLCDSKIALTAYMIELDERARAGEVILSLTVVQRSNYDN